MDKKSHTGQILSYMQKNPNKRVMAKYFQGRLSFKPFIGYEAITRLGDLLRMGLVMAFPVKREGGGRFAEYELTPMGKNYKF